MSSRTLDRLCWLFSVAWVVNLAAGMVPSLNYEPSPLATAPVMLILGAVFAAGRNGSPDEPGRHRGVPGNRRERVADRDGTD